MGTRNHLIIRGLTLTILLFGFAVSNVVLYEDFEDGNYTTNPSWYLHMKSSDDPAGTNGVFSLPWFMHDRTTYMEGTSTYINNKVTAAIERANPAQFGSWQFDSKVSSAAHADNMIILSANNDWMNNGYMVNHNWDPNTGAITVAFFKSYYYNGWRWTTLIQPVAVSPGWHTIKMTRSPSNLWTVHVDGDQIGSAQDNSYQNLPYLCVGRYGEYDNILVEEFQTNAIPLANAGENISICTYQIGSTLITGHASDENIEDILSYRWTVDGVAIQEWCPATAAGECQLILSNASISVGTHGLKLEVTDGKATTSDEMILTIDNTVPHVVASGQGVYETGTTILLAGEVSDFDGDYLTYQWLVNGVPVFDGAIHTQQGGKPVNLSNHPLSGLGIGTYTITLQVNDGINTIQQSNIEVTIADNTAPTLSPVSDKNILWPPNHDMVDIAIRTNANDNGGIVTISAIVTCNEAQSGFGEGDLTPDWTEPIIDPNTKNISIKLRSERSGSGNGRVYSLTINAIDPSGNISSTNIQIVVPHDRSKN